MWTGTKHKLHNVSKISVCCHSLTLGGAKVVGSDAVCVLGVLLTPDLSLDKHVTAVSAKCFFSASTAAPHPTLSRRRLGRYSRSRVRRQPGRILWQSLDRCAKEDNRQAAACPQCCSPDCLQHTQVYDRGLSQFRRRELHWLDADDRVRFTVCVQVYKCLHKMAPVYLSTLCQPVSSVPGRRHLRSARRGELDVPRVNVATYGGRAFAYVGPTSWYFLPAVTVSTLQTFKRHLKIFLFSIY